MKLDMLASSPVLGTLPKNQKMAELRSGNWMLVLEKEQLAQHVSYRPAEQYDSDAALRQKHSSNEIAKERSCAAVFPQAVLESSQLTPFSETARAEETFIGDAMGISGKRSVNFADQNLLIQPFKTSSTAAIKGWSVKQQPASSVERPLVKDAGDDHSSRQMHLYEKDGMVQVWIRDAYLSDTSLAPIMKSIKLELKESGKELTEVTVNGKRVAGRTEQITGNHDGRMISRSHIDQE